MLVPRVLLMGKPFLKDADRTRQGQTSVTTTLVPSPKKLQVGARCYLRGVRGWPCPRRAPAAGTGVSTGLEPVLYPNASPCLFRGCAVYTSPELCSGRASLAPSPSPPPPNATLLRSPRPASWLGPQCPRALHAAGTALWPPHVPLPVPHTFRIPKISLGWMDIDPNMRDTDTVAHREEGTPPPGTTLSQWTGGYRPLAQAPHIPPLAPPHPGHGGEGA